MIIFLKSSEGIWHRRRSHIFKQLHYWCCSINYMTVLASWRWLHLSAFLLLYNLPNLLVMRKSISVCYPIDLKAAIWWRKQNISRRADNKVIPLDKINFPVSIHLYLYSKLQCVCVKRWASLSRCPTYTGGWKHGDHKDSLVVSVLFCFIIN